MKVKTVHQVISFFLFALLSASLFAADPVSPLGYWITIDDVTHQPKSMIQIWETPDKQLAGKVIKLFKESDRVCSKCDGDEHNQRIEGMVFMKGLKRSAENTKTWSGGSILDPKNGKRYKCQLHLSENSQTLLVRGYIGLPLFGRSQTWIRETGI